MKNKLTATIAGTALLVALLNLSGRGLGFVREILFANYFGIGLEFDLYLISAVLPLTINSVFLNIAVNYFIPSYHRSKQNFSIQTDNLLSNSFWLFILSGILVSIILFFLASAIFSFYIPGASEDELSMVKLIFNFLLITIPINAGTSILIAYLQAEYQFKAPALSQIFVNIAFIFILIILQDKIGILTVPLAFILGLTIQLMYLIKFCPKMKLPILGGQYAAQIITSYSRILFSIVLIETVGQFYLLSDRYFYSFVDIGGIAALNYSFNLFLLPVSILSFSLTSVLFPRFSETISNDDKIEFRKNFIKSLEITLLIFIPIAVLFIFSGETIIRILYERGSFTAEATNITYSVLKIFSYMLPFYAVYAILNKVIYGIRKINILLLITLIALLIKILGNFILVKIYQQEGLAISTILSHFFFFITSILVLKNYTGIEPFLLMFKSMVMILFTVLISYFISTLFSKLFTNNTFFQNILTISIFFPVCYLSLSITMRKLLYNIKLSFSGLFGNQYPGPVI